MLHVLTKGFELIPTSAYGGPIYSGPGKRKIQRVVSGAAERQDGGAADEVLDLSGGAAAIGDVYLH